MIALLVLFLCGPSEPSFDSERPLSCGQASCFLLLSLLGHQVTLDSLDGEFERLPVESSFADLQQTLQRFGVDSSVWQLNWPDFQQIQGPMICHLTNEKNGQRHFHVAQWHGSDLVVFDPLAAHPIRITADRVSQYQDTFSGTVLVPTSGIPIHWRLFSASTTVLMVVAIVLATAGTIRWSLHRRRERFFHSCGSELLSSHNAQS